MNNTFDMLNTFNIINEIQDFFFSDKLIVEDISSVGSNMAILRIQHKSYPYPNKYATIAFSVSNNKFTIKKHKFNIRKLQLQNFPQLALSWMSFYVDHTQTHNYLFSNYNKDQPTNGLFSKTLFKKEEAIQYKYHSGDGTKIHTESYGKIIIASMYHHRINAPAVIEYDYRGNPLMETYFVENRYHNDAGPAKIRHPRPEFKDKGFEHYYIDGKLIGQDLKLYSKEAIQNFLLMG